MDTYVERRMEKQRDKKGRVLTIFTAIFMSVAVFIVLTPISGSYTSFVTPSVIAVIWIFTYRILRSEKIEYEILITNHWFDFDKITAKSDRKRLIETSIEDFSAFGKYDKTRLDKSVFKTKIYAYNRGDENLYYIGTDGGKLGYTLIVFSADDELLNAVKPHLSSEIRKELLGRN